MDPKLARAILAKRQAARARQDPARVLAGAFAQQRAFIEDPAKLKVAFCTRRAAKSYTDGIYLVSEALANPGCNCLFIGLTRASAKNILWKDVLKDIDRRYNLGATFNLTELNMTLPNGSIIRLTGVDAEPDEMNKLLGAKYRLACIDEASMYTIDVRNLVYGILKPAMADPNAKGERGTICLTGTSSNFTRGLFYDITSGKEPGWSVHAWSALDNPHVATQWQEELDEIRTLRPLYMETPQYKQWYLNQWVVDEDKLVYRFNEQRNLYDKLPTVHEAGWTYALGVDLGYEDDTAFVLTAYHANDPNLYVIKTFNKKHMTLDHVVAKIQEYQKDTVRAPSRVIIDGAAKQAVESMRQRSAIPFEYADKQGKVDFIEMLNSDLIQGKVKLARSCTALRDEMMSLVWKTEGDKIALPKREHPSLPNHLCDALLYNWRCCYHYQSVIATKELVRYSKEWYAAQAEDIWTRERERLENLSSDWPDDSGGWST
jgi:phage terminase large subunit